MAVRCEVRDEIWLILADDAADGLSIGDVCPDEMVAIVLLDL